MAKEDTERCFVHQKLLTEVHMGVKNIEKRLDSFVTQKEFQPIKKLVYGASGFILVGFLSAVVALIWAHAPR